MKYAKLTNLEDLKKSEMFNSELNFLFLVFFFFLNFRSL